MVLAVLLSTLFSTNNGNIQASCCYLHFTDITEQAGVGNAFTSVGVAFCDYDRDNNWDIYVTTYPGENRLYRNLGSNKFVDVASSSGINDPTGNGEGVAWGDIDNNGLPDLFICNEYTPNRLFHNDGNGHFTDITDAAGVTHTWVTCMCAAFGDIDGDGLLDLFVTTRDGANNGGNILYHNEGKCKFSSWTERSGVAGYGNSYGCSFADVNGDGYLDLYVVNADGLPNNLYINDGTGKFKDSAEKAGVTGGNGCTGCAFGDINNDGYPDLFVTTGYSEPDILYLNDGTGHFTDITDRAGVSDNEYGESVQFGDFNNDGYLDIFVANRCERNTLFLNNGDCTFRDVTDLARVGDCGGNHMGAAVGDIDNDGDLDIFVIDHSGWNTLYRNDINNKNYIKVRLEGTVSNREAIGSKVKLYDAGHAGECDHLRAFQEVCPGSGIHSSNPLECHFGACHKKSYDIEVTFPSGLVEVVRDIQSPRTIKIYEPGLRTRSLALAPSDSPITASSYPNPFHTFTQIRFAVPHSSRVSIRIYDGAGRTINEILNQELNRGLHTVVWDSKDGQGKTVPNGIYFYRIQGDNFSATNKLIFSY
jgi:hypothetical protein